jgi:predicted P-loop ATPase
VRLHKFADLDDKADPDSPVTALPSYKAMTDYALSLDEVKATRNRKAHESAQEDFKDLADPAQWMMKLKLTPGGKYEQTAYNISIVLEYDPRLKGRISRNTFENRVYGKSPLPWGNHVNEAEGQPFSWADTDDAGLRLYLEGLLKFDSKGKYDVAFNDHIARHSFNPIREYLDSLHWDGQPRLDNLLIDYLGAEDTPYVKAVTRKAFVACVSRIFRPGCKFDYMLVLIGAQGIGKSTLLSKMGRDFVTHDPGKYTNDSFRTFEGKEASEALNGSWLIEVAELDAMRKSESTKVKQFVTQLYDEYRPAYGRNKESFPRQCVFFGTGNSKHFLDDPTGNRRFWAVDLHGNGKKSPFTDLDDEIDQLWAEAVTRFKVTGEKLFLLPELEKVARSEQEKHRSEHPWAPVILDWLSKPIPDDWDKWTIDRRRDYWACNVKGDYTLVPRDSVCINEIWCECLMKHISQIKSDDSRAIGNILRANHFKSLGSRKHPPYGSCKLWQIDITDKKQSGETANE